jgi:acyl-CoA synthetase (AMP-forming)/AMP-acid ligase II
VRRGRRRRVLSDLFPELAEGLGQFHAQTKRRHAAVLPVARQFTRREVEDLLYGHEAVAHVAVVGLPDEHWGEIVAAFVQPRPGCELDIAELEALCRAELASYKVPRVWQVVDQFPQTASGKIQKFVLRADYVATHSAGNEQER